MAALDRLKCTNCSKYLIDAAFQAECGDRFCESCTEALKYKAARDSPQKCPGCEENISHDSKFYKDKAAVRELETTTITCTNQNCPWKGPGKDYKEHIESCKFTKISCPNKIHGCPRQLLRSQLSRHLSRECCSAPRDLQKSSGENSRARDRQVVSQHQSEMNAKFQSLEDAVVRAEKTIQQHQEHINKMELKMQTLQPTSDSGLFSLRIPEVQRRRTLDVAQSGRTVFPYSAPFHASRHELFKMMQTASYSGTFIWKITEVQRKRDEARSGRTLSLYSAPFYTSHRGYKMCLRLYMDGDGSGKGTHLSFFLTLMRGEYDALLTWPFRQTVSLTAALLDQDGQKDIFKSFRPDPSSSSFQQPTNEINISSGFPKFAPLSVLDNPSYVKNDTICLKGNVNCSSQPDILYSKANLNNLFK